MSALPKPKHTRLTLVPIKAFDPTAPAIVWPPVEGDTEHCDACGRRLDSHDVLTRGAMRAHLRNQEKAGFGNRGQLVHYSPAQRAERNAAVYGTPTTANTLETPLVAPCDVPSAEDKRATDKAALKRVFEAAPRDLQWLVTLAEIDYDAGDLSACGGSLWLAFKLEARDAVQDARAQAEREDWLDASDARRWMA